MIGYDTLNKGFKKIVLVAVLFSLPVVIFGSDRSEVWKRMYNRAQTVEQQHAIMQNIVAMDDPALSDMLDSALADQISTLENKMNRTERARKSQLMRMIVNELSSLRAEESAGTIFTLFNAVEDDHLL